MDSSLETHQSDGERGAIGSLHSPGKYNARSEFLPVHAPSAERHYSGGGAQPIHDVVVSRLFYHREQESHKRLVTKHFFDSYRGEEFLLERYLPSYRLNRLRERLAEVQKDYARFCESLRSGSLFPQELPKTPFASCNEEKWDTIVYLFCERFIPSVFDAIPSCCSRKAFRALLPAETPVEDVWFGDVMICPPPGLVRPVWVRCATAATASALVQQLNGHRVEYENDLISHGTSHMRLTCAPLSPPKRRRTLPPAANAPSRVAMDLAGAQRLLAALERRWGLAGELAGLAKEAAAQRGLGAAGETELVTRGMRRVFGVDYWRGADDGEFGVSLHVGAARA